MNFIRIKNQIELHFWALFILLKKKVNQRKEKTDLKTIPHPSANHHFSRFTTLKGPECAFVKIIDFQNDTLVFPDRPILLLSRFVILNYEVEWIGLSLWFFAIH